MMIGFDRGRDRLRVLGVGLATLFLATPLEAAADWLEGFDGGFANAWTFVAVDDIGNPPSTGVSSFDIIDAGADDYLRISHSTTAIADGGGGATDGFGYVSETFSTAVAMAEVNAQPVDGQQSLLGVFVRGDPVSGEAYVAAVNYTDSFFAIARNDNLRDFLNPLAGDFGIAVNPNTTHVVALWAQGSSIGAQLIDAATQQVVSTLFANDVSYTSGVSGVFVETAYDSFDNPIGPIVGTFDVVEALPEPGLSASLALGVGLLALLPVGRSRRRRGSPDR